MYLIRQRYRNSRIFKCWITVLISSVLVSCGGASEPDTVAVSASQVPFVAGNGKLKIFILAGQSNMEGYGKVDRGGDPDRATIVCPLRADGTRSGPANILGGMGSLRAMVNNAPEKYSYLVDINKTITYTVKEDIPGCVKGDAKTYSSWATRSDVHVSYWDERSPGVTVERRNGQLSVGFGVGNDMSVGEGYVGPEFGFGHTMGNALTDKVLLIKTSWGGKSLAVDFRPPSSVGLGVGSPTLTATADKTGAYYTEMVNKVRLVLSDIKKYYPDYDGKGFEVVGFAWHQGWNDRVTTQYVGQYEMNMANLIRDLRKDLNLPNMLVVIGNTGMAWAGNDKNSLDLINAQASIADPAKYPQFTGSVTTVDTRPFHYPLTSPEVGFIYHWNYNGESYFRVGESMGAAMAKLMKL
jgi:hypothetical protein